MKTGNSYHLILVNNPLKSLPPESTSLITQKQQFITTYTFLYDIFLCSGPIPVVYFKGVTSHCQERTNTYTTLSDLLACFLNQNSAKLLQKSNYLIALPWFNSAEVTLRPPVTVLPCLSCKSPTSSPLPHLCFYMTHLFPTLLFYFLVFSINPVELFSGNVFSSTLKHRSIKEHVDKDPNPIYLHGAVGSTFIWELCWMKTSATFLPIVAAGLAALKFLLNLADILFPSLPLHWLWAWQIRGISNATTRNVADSRKSEWQSLSQNTVSKV